MARWKIDRTTIFFCVVFFLFLWDLAYFLAYILGIRNPARFSHPFVIFTSLGDVEFLRGFPVIIRQMIFFLVSGGIVGVAIGSLALYSSWLTQATLRFLRIGLWLPFLVIFAVPETFWLSITVVILCTCYHYLAARSLLRLQSNDLRCYVAREATLQALFISLISQIWVQRWMWFAFPAMQKPGIGFGILAVLVVFLVLVNWLFRSSFDVTAEMSGTVFVKQLSSEDRKSFLETLLITVGCLTIWQLLGASRFNFLHSSPLEALNAAYYLFMSGEIWGDIVISLSEIVGGMVFGGSIAFVMLALLSSTEAIRHILFLLLPLLYISPIILWLFLWLPMADWTIPEVDFLFWQRVVVVGCLTFFPFIQALWGLRKRPLLYRVLMAIDDSLPIAFVAMCFGELYAAQAGLGFIMVVASATHQIDKGLAGFFVTVALLVGISSALRLVAKQICVSEEGHEIIPA